MADYPNAIETFPFYGATSADSAPAAKVSFGLTERFVNKIWDSGGPRWVYWETDYIDSTGQEYPDPYATGFGSCTGFRLVTIRRR